MANELNTSGINVTESFEDYLEHHGIKGMHWGIRRTPEQLGHKISKARERFEKYGKKAASAAEAGKTKTFEKYSKKAEKTYKLDVKLNDKLAKALKRQNEADEKVVNKGDLEEVISISDRLTEDQINRAYKRISAKQKLETLRPSVEGGLDKLVSVGGKVAKGAEHAYNIINNVNKFKGVMKDIQQSEIKDIEEAREKERAQKVSKATKTGKISEMKKVWNDATVAELDVMKKTLSGRDDIDAIAKARVEKQRADTVAKASRSGDIEKIKRVWASATVDELKGMKQTLVYRKEIEDYSKGSL